MTFIQSKVEEFYKKCEYERGEQSTHYTDRCANYLRNALTEALEEGKRMERERINTKMRNLFLELDDEIGIANSAKLAMFIRTALTPEEAPKTATP